MQGGEGPRPGCTKNAQGLPESSNFLLSQCYSFCIAHAGVDACDKDNLNKLLADMADEDQRSCRFQCVLVLMRHANDPTPLIAQASWEGELLTKPAGENGFGYDPIFWLADKQCTSAELSSDIKDTLSHRGQALRKLVAMLQEVPDFLS